MINFLNLGRIFFPFYPLSEIIFSFGAHLSVPNPRDFLMTRHRHATYGGKFSMTRHAARIPCRWWRPWNPRYATYDTKKIC